MVCSSFLRNHLLIVSSLSVDGLFVVVVIMFLSCFHLSPVMSNGNRNVLVEYIVLTTIRLFVTTYLSQSSFACKWMYCMFFIVRMYRKEKESYLIYKDFCLPFSLLLLLLLTVTSGRFLVWDCFQSFYDSTNEMQAYLLLFFIVTVLFLLLLLLLSCRMLLKTKN